MAICAKSSANVLTEAHFDELCHTAEQQGEIIFQQTRSELQVHLPQKLGSGGTRSIQLRNELTVTILDIELWQPLRLERLHDSDFPLVSRFYLSSHSRILNSGTLGAQSEYEETSDCNYLYCLPNVTEIEEWRSSEPIQVVMIYADLKYFKSFDWGSEFPALLQQLIEGNVKQLHQSLGKTTLQMRQIIQQLLQCPYQGLMQQLYLESKALELLSLQFMQWTEDERRSNLTFKLRADEVERLHEARAFLLNNASAPPSLMELARQVGLNERKLKQGFRQVFGTTVFGYLRNYRMQQAKQLLRNSNLTVASIAAMVGYRNPEAFSVAFQRQFAMSPKAYQLCKKG